MTILNYNQRKIFNAFAIITILGLLSACGIYQPSDARKVSPNADERVKKNTKKRPELRN